MTVLTRAGLSRGQVKAAAFLAMLTDHAALIFLPPDANAYVIMRFLGRMAMPLFSALFVEGFSYTKNRRRKAVTLLLCAIVSEPFFDLMLYGTFDMTCLAKQSTMLTWLCIFCILWSADWLHNRLPESLGLTRPALEWAAAVTAAVLLGFTRMDYNLAAPFFAATCYIILRELQDMGRRIPAGIVLAISAIWYCVMYAAPGCLLALPFAILYRPDKHTPSGKSTAWRKYAYYAGYPLHIGVLLLLRTVVC